jgi:hypothetical protein
MNTLTKQTFEDSQGAFPIAFRTHEGKVYVSHRSVAEFFEWSDRKRRREFVAIADFHPDKVAYFVSQPSRGGHFLTDPSTCTDFQKLDSGGKIQRFLSRQGLILAVFQENKHPRAKAFQDFCLSALETLFTQGTVSLPEARSLEEATEKLELEREKIRLEQTRANNETLRLTMGVKRLEIEQNKQENAELIRVTEKQAEEIDQLKHLRAHRLINQRKKIKKPSQTEYNRVCKFIQTLGKRKIVWKEGIPCFRSRAAYQATLPAIDRLRVFVPRSQRTVEWKLGNGKFAFSTIATNNLAKRVKNGLVQTPSWK